MEEKTEEKNDEFLMRTWAVVNLDAISENVAEIKSALPKNTKIMGVVKADAYGHGDVMIAKALVKNGVDFLAVSNIEEAISLRREELLDENSQPVKILILGYTPPHMASILIENEIAQTILSKSYAKELNCEAKRLYKKINVHIKVDTGMNRIGIPENEKETAFEPISEICALKNLNCEGIFTHLSSCDENDDLSKGYTAMQENRFDRVLQKLKENGIDFKYRHLQNSAGIDTIKNKDYDYARAGIILYGVPPSNAPLELTLSPVMSIKSIVSMVKEVAANEAVSYGRNFVTDKKTKIATVPIGYADGYSRLLSNKAYMLIRGQKAKILGNICMDQLMLDVTDIENVCEGDIVTVVGVDKNEKISFNDLADIIGTIGYELMCLVSKRVPRVYKEKGETVAIVDYII